MAKSNPLDKQDFNRSYTLQELAKMQGVQPIDDMAWQEMKLIANELWPDNQSLKAFTSFISELRNTPSP